MSDRENVMGDVPQDLVVLATKGAKMELLSMEMGSEALSDLRMGGIEGGAEFVEMFKGLLDKLKRGELRGEDGEISDWMAGEYNKALAYGKLELAERILRLVQSKAMDEASDAIRHAFTGILKARYPEAFFAGAIEVHYNKERGVAEVLACTAEKAQADLDESHKGKPPAGVGLMARMMKDGVKKLSAADVWLRA